MKRSRKLFSGVRLSSKGVVMGVGNWSLRHYATAKMEFWADSSLADRIHTFTLATNELKEVHDPCHSGSKRRENMLSKWGQLYSLYVDDWCPEPLEDHVRSALIKEEFHNISQGVVFMQTYFEMLRDDWLLRTSSPSSSSPSPSWSAVQTSEPYSDTAPDISVAKSNTTKTAPNERSDGLLALSDAALMEILESITDEHGDLLIK